MHPIILAAALQWGMPDKALAMGATFTITADCLTTHEGLRVGGRETNPFLGAHPSTSHLVAACAWSVGTTWLVMPALPKKVRRPLLVLLTVVEGYFAFRNLRWTTDSR